MLMRSITGGYFNPHSPRGERPGAAAYIFHADTISIHTPREGSDIVPMIRSCQTLHFNPHSPRGERHQVQQAYGRRKAFQSTLPARGATLAKQRGVYKGRFQSTLPARGATFAPCSKNISLAISIHTPREGSDNRPRERLFRLPISIHTPREGSDRTAANSNGAGYISIHTPREGSDAKFRYAHYITFDFNPHSPRGERRPMAAVMPKIVNFNPHSPRGERPLTPTAPAMSNRFQSTLPARGATPKFYALTDNLTISIHTPREGSDRRGVHA